MRLDDLVPSRHRAERLLLLDVLGGASGDAGALLPVAPRTLHPYLYARTGHQAFAAAYRENALLHLRRIHDLKQIDAALRAAAIPYLVLKGPILAATVYPDPPARTMLDLDLLVREADMARAGKVLAAIGFDVPQQFALARRRRGGDAIVQHVALKHQNVSLALQCDIWLRAFVRRCL